MRSFVSRALGSIVAVALVAFVTAGAPFACGPAQHDVELNHPYVTPPPLVSASAAPSSSLPRWAHADEVAQWQKMNGKRFLSRGHWFARYEADVRANEAAAIVYANLAPGVTFPVGAIVAKVHRLPSSETPAPMAAMEKTSVMAGVSGVEGWRFVEMDAEGHVLRAGALHPCVDCHAHVASQDGVFGVPVDGR